MAKEFTISTEDIHVPEYVTTDQNDHTKIQHRTAPEREWVKVELTEEERWFLNEFHDRLFHSIMRKFTQAGFDLAISLSPDNPID